MCQEHCGTDEVQVELAREASAKAAAAMAQTPQCAPLLADVPDEEHFAQELDRQRVVIGDPVLSVYDGAGNKIMDLPDMPFAPPPESYYAKRLAGDGIWPPVRADRPSPVPQLTGTPTEKLLRLSEELLECEFVDVDVQWYHKRLQEIKKELSDGENAKG